ncbi:MAG: hypothetical protein ACLFWF_09825 [Alphaproteobacteria bacterium]
MRNKYLCTAAILSAALLGDAGSNPGNADSTRPSTRSKSPVLVIDVNTYRWKLPEFRMDGKEAYAVVLVENTHDYPIHMRVNCRSNEGAIDEMTGRYTIPAREFLRMDTRRMQPPLKNGDGLKVKCRFHADSSAKIKAWVYDARAELAGRAATG